MRYLFDLRTRAGRSGVAWIAATLVLAAVFSLYGRAEFLMQLANQLWTCF